MGNLKVKERIEICEDSGLIFGHSKPKKAILEIIRKAGVTTEEVDEAWADIKARHEEAERREVRECEEAEKQKVCEREKAERREVREREEGERRERREEAERREHLELKRIGNPTVFAGA